MALTMTQIAAKKQKLSNSSAKETKSSKVVGKSKKTVESESSESEQEVSESESDESDGSSSLESEIDEDDEVDIEGISSASGSDSESESDHDEEDGDEAIPKLKKKKNTDDGAASFSTAVSAILNSKLKKHDRSDPILVRSKQKIKKFEEDKLEQKARRLINQERKAKLNSNRVRDLLPKEDAKARDILAQEKAFKKIAQRGVIKLFNAVLLTQTASAKQISGEKILGIDKKEELINEISKEKFLDLVQNAGK